MANIMINCVFQDIFVLLIAGGFTVIFYFSSINFPVNFWEGDATLEFIY